MLRGLAAERRMKMEVESAGTSAAHEGDAPDLRARDIAAAHGYDLSDQRARQVTKADFTNFDLILAMDANNLFKLQSIAPPNATAELKTFLAAAGMKGDVPDPYYSGQFKETFKLIETAAAEILTRLR